MKKADLEKHLGKKIAGRMQHEPHSARYGAESAGVADKREQRERDKAAGLVPFAVKLPQPLVTRLQSLAVERSLTLNDVTAQLLEAATASPAEAPAPKAKKAATAASDELPPPKAKKAATASDEAPAAKAKKAAKAAR